MSSERFPHFLIAVSEHFTDSEFHSIQWLLSQVSDRIVWPSLSVAVADLRGMQEYFKNDARLTDTFLRAHQQIPQLHKARFFVGRNLLHCVLFLNTETTGIFHSIDSQNLQFRKLMKSLTWEQWLSGALRFLRLYEHTLSTLKERSTQLSAFAKTMSAMRVSSPYSCVHTSSDGWNKHDELTRRFGHFVSFFWELFCLPFFNWHKCHPLLIRQEETPPDLRIYATKHQETSEFETADVIFFSGLVPALLACLKCCLVKIQRHNPFVPLGILDFKVFLSFGSGHHIERMISLNEGFFCLDRSMETILTEIFSRFFSTQPATDFGRGARTERERRVHETYTSEPSNDATTARVSGRLSNDSKRSRESFYTQTQCGHADWECVKTTQGLALKRHDEPSLAYFVSHIESIAVEPMRLCEKAIPLFEQQLFIDDSCSTDHFNITRVRKELLALTGQESDHYVPSCSFRRPYAARPLYPTNPEPHFSNLFSHAFQFRPPVVLRRPLRFLLNPQPSAQRHHLVFLEAIAEYEFFLYYEDNSNEGLWLCAPLSQDRSSSRHYNCLGYYDSLELLPDWLKPSRSHHP